MIEFLVGFWDYVVVFLVILTAVIFVHEAGHYLVARWNGVRVDIFSIGFGPELFGYTTKSGTRWKFSLFPLGGYVKMFGDADPASQPDFYANFTAAERTVAFQCKKVHQRAAIVAAGPLANFAFGIAALAVMFMVYGQPSTAPIVGQVQPDSAAAAAGLEPGDRVVEADGQTVDRFQDLQRIIRLTVGDPVNLIIERNGRRFELTAQPKFAEIKDALGRLQRTPVLGVVASPNATEIIHHSPASAVWAAFQETGDMVSATLTGVGQMLRGVRDTKELSGPIGIAKAAGDAAKFGLPGIVSMAILLSINLGLLNLFPVPLLDGGHLLFYGVEALLGRPLGPKVQEYGFRVGLILIFALMLLATTNDLGVREFLKGIMS
jgi:regulator of sigma E protease